MTRPGRPCQCAARRSAISCAATRCAIPDRPAIVALHSPHHARRVLTYGELDRLGQPARACARRARRRPWRRRRDDGPQLPGDGRRVLGGEQARRRGHRGELHVHRARAALPARSTPRRRRSSARTRSARRSTRSAEPLPDLRVRVVNDAYGDTASAGWERLSALLAGGADDEPESRSHRGLARDHSLHERHRGAAEGGRDPAAQLLHLDDPVLRHRDRSGGGGRLVLHDAVPHDRRDGHADRAAVAREHDRAAVPRRARRGARRSGRRAREHRRADADVLPPGDSDAGLRVDADLSRLRRGDHLRRHDAAAMFDAFARAAPQIEWVTLWSQSELYADADRRAVPLARRHPGRRCVVDRPADRAARGPRRRRGRQRRRRRAS